MELGEEGSVVSKRAEYNQWELLSGTTSQELRGHMAE